MRFLLETNWNCTLIEILSRTFIKIKGKPTLNVDWKAIYLLFENLQLSISPIFYNQFLTIFFRQKIETQTFKNRKSVQTNFSQKDARKMLMKLKVCRWIERQWNRNVFVVFFANNQYNWNTMESTERKRKKEKPRELRRDRDGVI